MLSVGAPTGVTAVRGGRSGVVHFRNRRRDKGSPRCVVTSAQKQKFGSFDAMLSNPATPYVLVDFYATWCGPCKLMADQLAAISPQFKDRVTFVKIDSDKYPKLAAKHNVQGLPTVILFKDAVAIGRLEGVMPTPGHLAQKLEQEIAKRS